MRTGGVVDPGVRIAVVGDYDPGRPYHRATSEALGHAADALRLPATVDWVPTDTLDAGAASGAGPGLGAGARLDSGARSVLAQYDGIFLAPGAPYRSTAGAFAAIRFAREQGWPFFGT